MSTSISWEGKGRYGLICLQINELPIAIPERFRSRLPTIRHYTDVLTFFCFSYITAKYCLNWSTSGKVIAIPHIIKIGQHLTL